MKNNNAWIIELDFRADPERKPTEVKRSLKALLQYAKGEVQMRGQRVRLTSLDDALNLKFALNDNITYVYKHD